VGLEDWRVLGEAACAYFRTGSFTGGARLVQAISEVPGVGDGHPDVDLRHEGVTIRLITITDDYYGLTERHIELARQISAVARTLDIPADPPAAQPGPCRRLGVIRPGRGADSRGARCRRPSGE
jgi:4a-hydroxytetrahydrobiopterin dehydratase